MKIVVMVGGVGGARFLLGVKAALGMAPEGASESPHEVTALVNTGDDVWMHGLRICPDLDTCMYTLGGGIDKERGWGHSGETWVVKEELAAYGADPDWFGLGDKDIATHLIRSRMLRAGYPLSAVTEALCDRWQPGVRLLPMSDDRVETHVVIDDPEQDGQQKADPLPGVVGALPRRAEGALDRRGRQRRGQARAGRARGDRRGRRGAARAVEPGRLGGHHAGRARDPGRAAQSTSPAWSGSPRSSAARRCAGWPTRA